MTNAGYNYDEIQKIVNNILSTSSSISNRKTNEEIANEVIRGLWGNGEQRYINLTNAGYDYNAIQAIVNSK